MGGSERGTTQVANSQARNLMMGYTLIAVKRSDVHPMCTPNRVEARGLKSSPVLLDRRTTPLSLREENLLICSCNCVTWRHGLDAS